MSWKNIGEDKRIELLYRYRNGEKSEALALEVGMRPGTLARRLRELAAGIENTDIIPRPRRMPMTWNKPPVFKGDSVVTGDYHLPYLDYDFADRMLVTAEAELQAPRRLIICGDLFNMDAFSPFPPTHTGRTSFKNELASARNFLKAAQGVFDYIEILLGNHELRIFIRTLGALTDQELRMLVGESDGINFYPYGYCLQETETGTWRITHQKNYSINAQTVGKKLASKFRQHVITHHQHKVSKGFDDSGESVVIDNGCMADPDMLAYTTTFDSTAPAMKQSFVVLKDGVGNLYANDVAFTEW